jgi:hypothetical protein
MKKTLILIVVLGLVLSACAQATPVVQTVEVIKTQDHQDPGS